MKVPSNKVYQDFELEQYIQELNYEVNSLVYSDDEGATKEDKFTEHVMENLADAGEVESYRICHYQKENRQEIIQYKINGFAIEEGFETLGIFISFYTDTLEIIKVSKVDFERLIKWPTNFVNAAFKGYLDEIEPSSEAHGLAKLIVQNREEFIRINVYILSNQNIVHDPPKSFKLKNLEELIVNFHVWDVERLHRLSQSKNKREPIEIDFKETFNAPIPCLTAPSADDLYECYLSIIPGNLLASLYQNYGTRLLESNVRAFLQQTGKVNKGIRDTIREEPFMFLPYNNGLAATALKVNIIELENGQIAISDVTDFQIVNGGQTTASLFHTAKKFKADLSNVYVQMKLTVIKDEDKKNLTVPNISRFANSQNKVSELDLTSNNPFLQKLEELSLTTYAIDPENSNKQTIWFFERVKGQYREAINKEPTKGKKDAYKVKYPRSQVIIKSEIAKYMNIWEQFPYHVAKGAQKNYNFYLKEMGKLYAKKKPESLYWKDVVANAILFKAADKLFGRKNSNPIGDTNIKAPTVSYTLSYLHYVTENRIDLIKIWDEQKVAESFLSEIRNGLIFVYKFLTSLDVALISEATKAEKTWKSLLHENNHPFELENLSEYLISEEEQQKRVNKSDIDTEEVLRYKNLEEITSIGVRFWDGLYIYNRETNILSDYQLNITSSIRSKLISLGSLTDRELKFGKEIITYISELKIEFQQLTELSKLEEINIDPTKIHNKLARVSEDDWKRIIDLGEQTKIFNGKEISTIKTVKIKLKRKNTIDLKRLQITDEAISRLKKYGIKY